MHFQNIDFDIDIESFVSSDIADIDIGIDIEKNGVNIEILSSERGARASQTLSFLIDSFFFSPLSFDIVFLSFGFFLIILGMICIF